MYGKSLWLEHFKGSGVQLEIIVCGRNHYDHLYFGTNAQLTQKNHSLLHYCITNIFVKISLQIVILVLVLCHTEVFHLG